MWQIGGIIVTALVGVIGVLWNILLKVNKDKTQRLIKHEAKEEKFHADMRELSSSVSRLEGEKVGEHRGIEKIVESVTNAIRDSHTEVLELGMEIERKKRNGTNS